MNLFKKIARLILSDELDEERRHYQKIFDDLKLEKEALENLNKDLRYRLFGKRKVLISQQILECVVKCLPDPNAVGTGRITASEISKNSVSVTESIAGVEYKHFVFVKKIEGRDDEIGAVVHITNYLIDIFVPLRREKVSYEAFGVNTEIDTFFWDFYGAGIRMLSNEAWKLSTEFIRAQRNVLSEFKQEGLL